MPEKVTDNVLAWGADLIEPNTIEQAERTARLPFVNKPLALMPDAHFGMGATVGSVIATHGAIMPAAVGVDIGCGMIAAHLGFDASALPDDLTALHSEIARRIPAGVGKAHERPELIDIGSAWMEAHRSAEILPLTQKQASKARTQFGTLGSGNHFVEICLDESDGVWIVLHSGSRGVGNLLAQDHIERAKGIMKRYFIELEDPDLAYLAERTPEFDAYIVAMTWAQDYAAANRAEMLSAVKEALAHVMGRTIALAQVVNCHHNFTEREHHHGRDFWITRKGAIRAREGDLGVIPGSMGTGTFIVSGKGSAASYASCSHGAGRTMSRGQARRTLTVDDLRERMAGKAWNEAQADALLDEHPSSYKDVGAVMEAQSDLVTIEHTLRQVLNYKGA
jgi:tRNA-splicing ligase RtcB